MSEMKNCQSCIYCCVGSDLHKNYLYCNHPNPIGNVDKDIYLALKCKNYKEKL